MIVVKFAHLGTSIVDNGVLGHAVWEGLETQCLEGNVSCCWGMLLHMTLQSLHFPRKLDRPLLICSNITAIATNLPGLLKSFSTCIAMLAPIDVHQRTTSGQDEVVADGCRLLFDVFGSRKRAMPSKHAAVPQTGEA